MTEVSLFESQIQHLEIEEQLLKTDKIPMNFELAQVYVSAPVFCAQGDHTLHRARSSVGTRFT